MIELMGKRPFKEKFTYEEFVAGTGDEEEKNLGLSDVDVSKKNADAEEADGGSESSASTDSGSSDAAPDEEKQSSSSSDDAADQDTKKQ